MTYVVTDDCINCKYTKCVDACPVKCFHEGPNFTVIDPDECIDCGECEAVCPSDAIYPDDDIPSDKAMFLEINANLADKWPLIMESKKELPTAAESYGKEGKIKFLQR